MKDQSHAITPWHNVETRYQAGQQVQGSVTRITHFGIFVQIEPGLEGIIYTFELGPGPASVANFVPGQVMQLYVKSIDAGRKRMELSLEPQHMPSPLEAQALLTDLRRNPPTSKQLSWPPQLPDMLPQLPSTSPQALFTPGEHNCPTCQCSIQATWKYCVYCGDALRRRCPACGNEQPNLPQARYCCKCGKIFL